MTKEEFITQCSMCGICSKKFAQARTKKDSKALR